MMRIRLVWFTLGFTSASAAMSHFIFRDLWAHQLSLSSQLEEKFGVLGTRVSNLEIALHDVPNTQQDTYNAPFFGFVPEGTKWGLRLG